jgi:hypothetical protein
MQRQSASMAVPTAGLSKPWIRCLKLQQVMHNLAAAAEETGSSHRCAELFEK